MKVICFGDSNTYGYDPRGWLGDRYDEKTRWVGVLAQKTGWKIVNRGQNGREIPGAPVPIPGDVDLFIVMLGTNDLLQGHRPEAVSKKMELFLLRLELIREKILLVAPPPMKPGEWVPTQELADDSVALAGCYRMLSQRLGVRFVDAGQWEIPLVYDGVHFTEEGHRAFAEGLYRYLRDSFSREMHTFP